MGANDAVCRTLGNSYFDVLERFRINLPDHVIVSSPLVISNAFQWLWGKLGFGFIEPCKAFQLLGSLREGPATNPASSDRQTVRVRALPECFRVTGSVA
jgi:hypothetical protein